MTDPSRPHPMRFYVTAFCLAVAVVSGVLATASFYRSARADGDVAREAKVRSQQLQNALCGTAKEPGLLPTIANAPLTATTSALGRELVSGAKHAADIVRCPK